MKHVNFALVVGFCMVSAGAFAADLSVTSFKVIRDGGGQAEALVTLNEQQEVQVKTISCSYRELTADEQKQTLITLSGAEATDALTILHNAATLASDASITDPQNTTGTWASLAVNYKFVDDSGELVTTSKKITAPIVIIGSKVSDVLTKIETLSSAAALAVCE